MCDLFIPSFRTVNVYNFAAQTIRQTGRIWLLEKGTNVLNVHENFVICGQ
jgi:hypothetical protein